MFALCVQLCNEISILYIESFFVLMYRSFE